MAMDLNAILQQFIGNGNQQINATQQAVQAYDKDTMQIQGLLRENEQQAAGAVQLAGQVAQQEAAIGYKVASAKERNAAIAGMDPDVVENEYVRSMAAYNAEQALIKELEPKRAEALRTVEAMASTSFIQDPLQFLVAQLALPQAAAAHNQLLNMETEAVARRDAAARNISTRVQLINAKDSIIAANTADELNAVTLKKNELAMQNAQVALRQAQAENISKIGTRALESFRLASSTYQIQSDMLNKMMSLEQWKLQREALAQSRADAAEARRLRAEKAKEEDAERALLNRQLEAASAALGYLTPITLTSLKQLPQAERERLLQVAVSGKFGNGVLDSIQTVRQSGNMDAIINSNPGMVQSMKGLETGIQSYIPAVTNEALRNGVKLKPKDSATQAADAYEQDVVSSAQSFAATRNLNSSTWDKVFNPYKPQYLALVDMVDAGRIPQLQGNSVVQAVKTMRASMPNKINLDGGDMEVLMKTLAMEVSNGRTGLDKISSDLAVFHRYAAARNKDLYAYTQFGLPEQTSAIISLPPSTLVTDPFKVDLMDPASVKSNLARMAREQKLGTIGMMADGIVWGTLPGGENVAPKITNLQRSSPASPTTN